MQFYSKEYHYQYQKLKLHFYMNEIIKLIIIEDEESARKSLKRTLDSLAINYIVLNEFESIRSAVNWLKNNQTADLIFMDIQLSDGLSFEIFNRVKNRMSGHIYYSLR